MLSGLGITRLQWVKPKMRIHKSVIANQKRCNPSLLNGRFPTQSCVIILSSMALYRILWYGITFESESKQGAIAVSLPCSVQIFKTIRKPRMKLWKMIWLYDDFQRDIFYHSNTQEVNQCRVGTFRWHYIRESSTRSRYLGHGYVIENEKF